MNIEAHAKINFCLDITGIRENGYHDVRMIMQSLELCDEVELEILQEDKIELSVEDRRRNINKEISAVAKVTSNSDTNPVPNSEADSPISSEPGKFIPLDQDNLMYKAAMRMKEAYGIKHGFRMHLVKKIPAAAGLAGGSADAAAVMRGINEICGLHRPIEELMELGTKLGADIPYCILGGTALAEGIGEKLTSIHHNMGLHILLVKPELGLSTPQVYGAYDKALAAGTVMRHPEVDRMVEAIQHNDIANMYACVGNVLEYAVIPSVPLINTIKEDMLLFGAECTCMTGSGSTVFGLFQDKEKMQQAAEKFRKVGYLSELSDIITTKMI